MRYLFDTEVLSQPTKRPTPGNAAVIHWLKHVPSDQTAISTVSIFEAARGIARLQTRDPVQAGRLQVWLNDNLEKYRGRILEINTRVALAAAQLHASNPKPDLGSLIAATAIVHGLTVVTRNVKDFEPMGVPVLNPWEL